jgi:hypothetical protein
MRRAFLLAVPLILATQTASAQEGASDHDTAVALFDDARRLIEQKDCDNAVLKLELSLKKEPSVGAHLSMADCLESHTPLEAWKHLREAQRLAYLHRDERTKVASDRAAALEQRLPIVHVVVPATVLQQPGLEVRVDGQLIDPFFYETGILALPAGPHTVEATTPARQWSHDVVAQAGATTAVTVQLQPIPAGAGPVVVEPPDHGKSQRTVGIIVGVVGLGGLALGGVFGAAALVKKSDIQSACGGSTSNCTATAGSQDGAMADVQTFSHVSTIGLIVGGVALAAGLVLYLTAPHGRATAPQVGVGPGLIYGRF